MKVSVVTPTYNAAPYLDRAIQSVLAQGHDGVEHIVVDGASSDGTVDLLRRYPHLVWTSEHDDGLYSAVNKGLARASGDIVGYLNADDRLGAHALHHVRAAFEADPELDFVYGNCTFIDETERTLYTLRPLPFVSPWLLGARIFWAQPACFWRRRVHDRVGYFDPAMRNAGDYDFFLRMVHAGLKGRRIRKSLASFMRRADCLSDVGKNQLNKEVADIERRYGLVRRRVRYVTAEVAFGLLNLPSLPSRLRLNLGWY